MKLHGSTRKWIIALIAVAFFLLGSLVIVLPGFAQAERSLRTEDPSQSSERLEELLQKQIDLLLKQEERLAKAEQTISQIEERIKTLDEQGVDTVDAQAALDAFIAEIEKVESFYTAAKEILKASEGFDDDGMVIDTQAALETLRMAATEQRQFHLTLSSAARDLRFALQDTIADTRLENLFARQREIQEKQAERMENADEVKLRLEEFIQDEQAAGRDTKILEEALEAFKKAISDATEEHKLAEKNIASRAGFDADGQVSDVETARETVQKIGEAQRSFHLTAAQASVDLRQSIRAYQELWGEAQDGRI
jgi:hypothetical protein